MNSHVIKATGVRLQFRSGFTYHSRMLVAMLSVLSFVLSVGCTSSSNPANQSNFSRRPPAGGNAKPSDAPSPAPKVKLAPEHSLSLFKPSVYALAKNWCGGPACHAAAQAPLISHDDPAKALDSVLKTAKVDFSAPERSRLYLRLSKDEHNCPKDLGCAAAAEKMLAAIKAWAADLTLDNGAANFTKTSPVAISSAVKSSDEQLKDQDELTFDLSNLLKIPDAKLLLLMEKAYDNTNTYLLSRPRLVLPTSETRSVHIKGIRVIRNDQYLSDAKTFVSVDVTLGSPGGDLSLVGATIDQDKGDQLDQISLAFDEIKVVE